MSETAKALVEKLVEAGEWPEPALLDEILAQGQEAVEPLLEVVRSRPRGWPAEAPLDHAIVLLCMVRPPEAMPALVDVLRDYHNETAETVAENAGVYGVEVIEPALAVVRDASLSWYSRAAATDLAIRAAGKDPEPRARVAATLRELLQQQLALAPKYVGVSEERAGDEEGHDVEEEAGDEAPPPGSTEDFFEMATSFVADLAALADPEARELIRQAFEADVVDTWMIGKEDVAEYYREGGRKTGESDPRAGLERYRADYEHHRAEERRKPLELSPPRPALPPATFERDYLDRPPQPFVRDEGKPGRNEPCWCGSGKKYKNCHMRQDRQ